MPAFDPIKMTSEETRAAAVQALQHAMVTGDTKRMNSLVMLVNVIDNKIMDIDKTFTVENRVGK